VNVVPEDAKGGATYACVAENRVMRSIQRGEYNTIAPHGGVYAATVAILDVRSLYAYAYTMSKKLQQEIS